MAPVLGKRYEQLPEINVAVIAPRDEPNALSTSFGRSAHHAER